MAIELKFTYTLFNLFQISRDYNSPNIHNVSKCVPHTTLTKNGVFLIETCIIENENIFISLFSIGNIVFFYFRHD